MLFDISTQDKDQRGFRVSYCTNFVDRKWQKATERKQKQQLVYEKMRNLPNQ